MLVVADAEAPDRGQGQGQVDHRLDQIPLQVRFDAREMQAASQGLEGSLRDPTAAGQTGGALLETDRQPIDVGVEIDPRFQHRVRFLFVGELLPASLLDPLLKDDERRLLHQDAEVLEGHGADRADSRALQFLPPIPTVQRLLGGGEEIADARSVDLQHPAPVEGRFDELSQGGVSETIDAVEEALALEVDLEGEPFLGELILGRDLPQTDVEDGQ